MYTLNGDGQKHGPDEKEHGRNSAGHFHNIVRQGGCGWQWSRRNSASVKLEWFSSSALREFIVFTRRQLQAYQQLTGTTRSWYRSINQTRLIRVSKLKMFDTDRYWSLICLSLFLTTKIITAVKLSVNCTDVALNNCNKVLGAIQNSQCLKISKFFPELWVGGSQEITENRILVETNYLKKYI